MTPNDGNVMDDAENIVDSEGTVSSTDDMAMNGGVSDDPEVNTPETEELPFEQVDGDDGSGI